MHITAISFKHYQPNAFYKDISQAPWLIVDVFDDFEHKLHVSDSLSMDVLGHHANYAATNPPHVSAMIFAL